MCRKRLTIVIICILMAAFLSINASANLTESDMKQYSQNIRENGDGEYTLYDNYAKFDGTVYEYNLNNFFKNSELTVYTYSLASEIPETGSVEIIDDEILRIIPHSQMSETIVITATGLGGEVFETKFNLNFIDCAKYETDKAVGLMWIAVLVLAVLIVFNFAIPIKGSVRYNHGNGNTNSKSCKSGVALIDKCSPVKGLILGGNGKFIYLVFFGNVYTDENCKNRASVVKLNVREEMFFYSESGNRIGVYFYK